MELKPNSAKIIDMATELDAVPLDTPIGPVVWATVRIEYALAGLAPTVDIRVPIPFERSETDKERHTQALRSARLLIDHACRAAGIVPDQLAASPIEEALDQVLPAELEGITQELGLTSPRARSQRFKRRQT